MAINYGDKIPENSDLSTVISYVGVLNNKVKELRDELANRLKACDIDTSSARRIEQLIALINNTTKLPAWTNNGVWINAKNPSFTIYDGVALVLNDYIYIIGGKYMSSSTPVVVNSNRRYSIENNTWENLGTVPYFVSQHTGGVLNNKIYIYGGNNGGETLGLLYEYDPSTNTWTQKTSGASRQNHATVVLDGLMYSMGGYNQSYKLKTMQAYSADTDTFSTKAAMVNDREGLTADIINGKIYAIGGIGNTSVLANECYDPVTNTWTSMKNLPSTIYNHGSGVSGDKIILIDGYDNRNFLTKVFYYDPINNNYYDECTDDTTKLRNIITTTTKYGIFCLGGETSESKSIGRAMYYKTGKLRCLSEYGSSSGGSSSGPVEAIYYIYNNGVYEHADTTGEFIIDEQYPDTVNISNNDTDICITLNPDVLQGPSTARFRMSNLDTSKYDTLVVEYRVEHSTSYVNPKSNCYISATTDTFFYNKNFGVGVGNHQVALDGWTVGSTKSVELVINFEVEYGSDYNGRVQIILNKVYLANNGL